ncbi:hypothetical protein BJ912DRAFT_950199 [Pholiota molesta]|nr:hypothetical protein BJ912DRAFT_950199 [Pholiota molesta]
MSEVRYGVLLSGGLDSSLIAAVAARETERETISGPSTPTSHLINEEATLVAWPQLHSFSISLENSPDLVAARKAAHYLGTVHTRICLHCPGICQ